MAQSFLESLQQPNTGLAQSYGDVFDMGTVKSNISNYISGPSSADSGFRFYQNRGTQGLNTPDTGFNMKALNKWFGDNSETLSGIGDIAGLAGGLAGTFAGFKQLGLQEDAFNFNKSMKEKEYAMAKDAYDKNVARAKSIGDQMNAGKVG